jgi:hypothetical protein
MGWIIGPGLSRGRQPLGEMPPPADISSITDLWCSTTLKYPESPPLNMHWRFAIIPLLMVLVTALGAGCAGTGPGPAQTQTPTQTLAPVVTTPAVTTAATPVVTTVPSSLQPGPTVTVPPNFEIAINVLRDSNTYTRKITVIFQGGKGQFITQEIDVKVTHEDGTTETKSIVRPESGSIPTGSSVIFTGTTQDRVEVTAMLNGVSYKIYDQLLPLRSIS